MREIKFRAWDKEYKKYYQGDHMLDMVSANGSGDIYYLNKQLIVHIGEADDFVVEQYTGLKDKNDVEIYEGDIIKITGKCFIHLIDNDYSTHIVKWNSEESGFWFYGIYYASENSLNSRWTNFFAETYPMEVIGNIHENPELLEDNS